MSDGLTNDEFNRMVTEALEREATTHDGAAACEDWMTNVYPRLWHKTWQDGRQACLDGVARDQNPHKLKVWREVWWYGWDNYDPNPPAVFRQMEQALNALPTRPMTEGDL